MATYSSKPIEIPMQAESVYEKVSNLSGFQERIDNLPQDVKDKIGAVRFTEDSIIINAATVGDMVLSISEKVPGKRVAFTANGAPVPIVMSINLENIDNEKTLVTTCIDVEIPAMLKPLVGPKLQEAAEKFGDMIGNIAKY
ncbi:hypothetical protein [Muribaculum caecicola]|jgi:hypothetical protein|uniref:Uncharacterized protein n=3 Tax=Muribaculum TaxID=1918540 RepID=A0AC61S4P9_9BACT|nr:hypothetical protein [Muribaculum caecicola]THG47026.1 hypothetical protein E5990_07950 [Muribaculum caecicola]